MRMIKGCGMFVCFWMWVALAFPGMVVVGENVLESAKAKCEKSEDDDDVHCLYRVGQEWWEQDEKERAVGLWKQLAKEPFQHVKSMVQLGHLFASNPASADEAIAYFSMAVEVGNHHASMYNVGRLLVESKQDYVGGIAYIREASALTDDPSIASVSQQALQILYQRISSMPNLPLSQVADIFLFASSTTTEAPLPPEAEELWTRAILAAIQFNETFVQSHGQTLGQNTPDIYVQVTSNLHSLWQSNSDQLSQLQQYLLLDVMNDFIGPLAGMVKDEENTDYVMAAAQYAQELANTPLCYSQYAIVESDPACFNGAISSAVSYYRRASATALAQKAFEQGQSHPHASTKYWTRVDQTPRVYHPNYTAQPWWDPNDFSIATSLQTQYNQYKDIILQELQTATTAAASTTSVEMDGKIISDNDDDDAMKRIYTPFIGIYTQDDDTEQKGAGGWAELGPLFDGRTWNEDMCQKIPTICTMLKQATTNNENSLLCMNNPNASPKQVWDACGSPDAVVTILRLRPGTTLRPHCGTTNGRLIMHFPLIGADGIDFTVGEQLVQNYGNGDGHAIVFDDSFEHYVHHGGTQDRFIILAVLKHPDHPTSV